jgi:DMSO/TMAO reductase YedYZ molybdopterin-dependent catalytic subunit
MTRRPPAPSRRDLLAGLGTITLLSWIGGCDKSVEVTPEVHVDEDPLSLTAITPNGDHYVTSCCATPELDASTWTLSIGVRGEVVATVTMAWLDAQAARDKEHTFECISARPFHQAISNAVWTGLPLTELFTLLGVVVPDTTVALKFTSADDYTTAIPVQDLDLPAWLVWRMNGEPLPADHGFPARLIVPTRYGMKSPKWVTQLDLIDEPYIGFWEAQGWSDSALIQPNTLVRWPTGRLPVRAGKVHVIGTAFAGRDPIAKVEVKLDDGAWRDATLDYVGPPDVWSLWSIDLFVPAGIHKVVARCTTVSGAQSGDNSDGTPGLVGYDGSMQLDFEAV